MIIGYARISTGDQNLNLQEDALKLARCEKIYSDVMSGSRQDRPNLQKCMQFLKSGDTLVVWKLDRLGRSLKHLINTVLDLNDRGVDVVVTTMSIDTRTPHGKLLFGILASISEFERSLIRERVTAGLEAARMRGKKIGRPGLTSEQKQAVASALERGSSKVQAAKDAGISRASLYNMISSM